MAPSTSGFPFDQKIAWEPDPETIAQSNLTAFMRRFDIGDLSELQDRSTQDIGWFWNAVMKHLDIRFRTPYTKIVDLSDGPEFPRWCVDGRMNIIDLSLIHI